MGSNTMSLIAESNKSLSLRDLAAPLFRRKKLLIISFLAVMALLTLLGTVIMPPPYSSSMDMIVKGERFDPVVTPTPTTQLPMNSSDVTLEEINSEVELLTSHDVLEKVVFATGMNKPKPSFLDHIFPEAPESERVERSIRKLAKGIKAENKLNTNLIEVTYKSPDPHFTYDVLNSLSAFYLDKHASVSKRRGSYEFFATEAKEYQNELNTAEGKLKNFSRTQGLSAPDEERSNLAQQVANGIGQYHTAEGSMASDVERIRSDEEHIRALPQRSPTVQVSAAADKLLEDLRTNLLIAETKRTQLAMKYDAQYPLVREADDEIAQTKAAIASAEATHYVTETTDRDPAYELLREDIAKTQADLAAQRAAVQAGKQSVKSMQDQMVTLDQDALTQHDLQRDAKADEDNYLLYLSKREQERTTNALNDTTIGNVALAIPPSMPSLPLYSYKTFFLIAILGSLIISIGVAYGADYFDASFHTPAQVSDMLGIPIVISMPKRVA